MKKGRNISTTLTSISQLLTGSFHAVSLFVTQHAENDTEKELLHLMQTYTMDMGSGFHPTMYRLSWALSTCFTLLYIFGGIINSIITPLLGNVLYKRIVILQIGIFGLSFLIMATHTFLPPIICTGIVFLGLIVMFIFKDKN
jgi:hypothetical protein